MMTTERRPLKYGHISRICVAIDAAGGSEDLAQFAISLVRNTYHAEIDFVHVINTQRMIASSDRSLEDYGHTFDLARDAARAALARCMQQAQDADVFARSFVRFGDPAAEAARFARGRLAQLLVIGNRPTSAMHRLINGSVRDDLVRTCSLPLLLAPHMPYRPAEFTPHAIVVAADQISGGSFAKRLAADVAADFAAHLIYLQKSNGGRTEAQNAIDAAIRAYTPGLLVMTCPRTRRFGRPFGTTLVARAMQRMRVPLLIVRAGYEPGSGSCSAL